MSATWEQVKSLPTDLPPHPGEGAYRSTDGSRLEHVVAHRPPASPFGAFLAWLASHEAFPFRDQPIEVVVTDDDVYVRRRDRTVLRIARAELRSAARDRRGNTTYLFGRDATLLLSPRSDCPVMATLDADLAR